MRAEVVDGCHWDVEINVCQEVSVVWRPCVLVELMLILPAVLFHVVLLKERAPTLLNLMRGIRRMLRDHPLEMCSRRPHHRHRLRAGASGAVRRRRIPRHAH